MFLFTNTTLWVSIHAIITETYHFNTPPQKWIAFLFLNKHTCTHSKYSTTEPTSIALIDTVSLYETTHNIRHSLSILTKTTKTSILPTMSLSDTKKLKSGIDIALHLGMTSYSISSKTFRIMSTSNLSPLAYSNSSSNIQYTPHKQNN